MRVSQSDKLSFRALGLKYEHQEEIRNLSKWTEMVHSQWDRPNSSQLSVCDRQVGLPLSWDQCPLPGKGLTFLFLPWSEAVLGPHKGLVVPSSKEQGAESHHGRM